MSSIQIPQEHEGGAVVAPERDETRRVLLAKGALVAGGFAFASLARAEPSLALGTQLEGFNNVKDPPYQAKGDGTDYPSGQESNTSRIRRCINDSAGNPSIGKAGAAVYFPPGTYLCGTLFLPSYSVLIGHGRLSVIKSIPVAHTHMLVNNNFVDGNTDILIDNLTVDGSNSVNGTLIGMFINEGNPGHHERIFVRRVEGFGTPTTAMCVNYMYVRDGAVTDCYFHDLGLDGIHVQGESSDVLVQGNIVIDTKDDSIATGYVGSPKRISIVGNICKKSEPNGSAICCRGGEDQVSIVGNVCIGGYRAGIEVDAHTGTNRDIEISNNVLVEPGNSTPVEPLPGQGGAGGGSGILLYSGLPAAGGIERVNIKDNLIFAPRHHGILIRLETAHSISDVAISGNLIWGGLPSGAQSDYRSGSGSGIACIPHPPAQGSITDVRITANDIRSMNDAGITVKGAQCKRFDIQKDRILDSGTPKTGNPVVQKPGILVDSASEVTIAGNRAQDTRQTGKTQDYGLTITNPTGDVVIAGNTFTGNAATANNGTINFSGAAGTARLRIRDNPGFNPWTGQVNASGTWTSFNPASGVTFWRKDIDVTYPVPFPAGQVPKVLLTSRLEGFAASVINPLNTKFTCRVCFPAPIDPGSNTVTVNWLTKPVD